MPKRSLEGYVPPPLFKRRKHPHTVSNGQQPPLLFRRNTNQPRKRSIEITQAGQPVSQKRQKPLHLFETRLCAGFTEDELKAACARYNELLENNT